MNRLRAIATGLAILGLALLPQLAAAKLAVNHNQSLLRS